MMHTASLEPCKELYKLSGWGDTYFWYAAGRLQRNEDPPRGLLSDNTVAAYDLGYLLRRLKENKPFPLIELNLNNRWWAKYGYTNRRKSLISPALEYRVADTPENAVTLLCIELFKQGILKREDTKGE